MRICCWNEADRIVAHIRQGNWSRTACTQAEVFARRPRIATASLQRVQYTSRMGVASKEERKASNRWPLKPVMWPTA